MRSTNRTCKIRLGDLQGTVKHDSQITNLGCNIYAFDQCRSKNSIDTGGKDGQIRFGLNDESNYIRHSHIGFRAARECSGKWEVICER